MKTIVVKALCGATDIGVLHSLRNVGEDVYGKFYFDGIAEVPDMDSAVTELHIKAFLKKSLKRYNLTELVEITRDDSKFRRDPRG